MKALVLVLTLLTAATAFGAQKPLTSELETEVRSVIGACVKYSSSGAISIKRDCSDVFALKNYGEDPETGGNLYSGFIALGEQDLVLQVITGGGMDNDENSVTFYDQNRNVVAFYPWTTDGITSGLELLAQLF